MNTNYQQGILYLVHLLTNVDGHVDESEILAVQKLKQVEKIPDHVTDTFEKSVIGVSDREIFRRGVEFINKCSEKEKLRALTTLYKISEIDGRVHVNEIKMILYSIELIGVEFEDVVREVRNEDPIL